jgi:peptidoglycan/LPS O-acetylase OafA/YrhL
MQVKKSAFQISSLDGMRAVAVAIVFVHHAGINRFPGGFGVTIFFFLSGFLITTLLRMEFDRSGTISLRDFYLRRVLRIFPPFYLVWALVTGLTLVGALRDVHLTPSALLAQVLYVSNYFDTTGAHWWADRAPGTWVFWSLAVEEHFYLVFPLLYLLLRRHVSSRYRQAAIVLGLCAFVLAWRFVLVFALGMGGRVYVATDTRIDSLLFGCALAIAANPVLDPLPFAAQTWRLGWLPVSLAALLASLSIHAVWFQETLSYTIQGVFLAPVFVAAIQGSDRFVFRALNWSWVQFVGVLSYSIYLVHNTVVIGLSQWLAVPALVKGALAALLSIVIAAAIHELVEKPCTRLRRRLSHVDGNRAWHQGAGRLRGRRLATNRPEAAAGASE